MKKDFEILKEMLKEDFGEAIFALIVFVLAIYLILISKIVLAVFIGVISLLGLITYRIYSGKKAIITKRNKKYYEFLGKLWYVLILLVFSHRYFKNLFYILKNKSRGSYIALLYPRIVLLSIMITLLLYSFYLLRKWIFKREIFFSIISLAIVYEILILFFVNKIYGIRFSNFHMIDYSLFGFLIILCFWMIWIDAKRDKNFKK